MQNRTIALVATALAAVALTFAACSDTGTGPTPPDSSTPSFAKGGPSTKPVKSVSVSPSGGTIVIGGTLQLTATASPPNTATSFTWASTNQAVATVSQAGLVTGVAAGTANIQATAGGKTGTATVTVLSVPPAGTEVLVGAGDIASCSSSGDEATAAVLDNIAGTVFTLGDNAYENGTSNEYANCYGPTWGRHKSRTKPTPGNHEYNTANASGYYGYFGSAAGNPSEGYYSYDLGAWHIIVLNSSSGCGVIGCALGSAQDVWLRGDLAANSKLCTLAYWHHPRFNSGAAHGNNTNVAPFWDALYQYNADVVLNGHEHVYERFAPQRPDATPDAANGIRQFTVGTGGREHYSFKATPEPNSQVRNATADGVLKLTLRTNGYDWEFVPAGGATFTDSGTGTCH
jgi:hypothetical protein